MRILIAEDDRVSRRMLEATLSKWGYDVEVTCDGAQALEILLGPAAPPLAILDWMMPIIDGVEICHRLRTKRRMEPAYIILLTAKGNKEDIVAGLDAGADDYLTKPFDRGELRARLRVGIRTLELHTSLAERVRQLEEARSQVKQLEDLIPICCYCKKVRDDRNYWL